MASEMTTTSGEEKKLVDEKRYAIVTKESIRMVAEATGISDLPDDVAAVLGEDVSYRLREITMCCTQFMKHAKRRRLTTEDFNKALRQSDIQPVFGHGSMEPSQFRQTREGELHFVEDLDTNFSNIVFNSYVPKNLGKTSIKAQWLAVEGTQKTTSSQQGSGKLNIKKEISEDQLLYYNNITKSIISGDEKTVKVALSDLQTNPNVTPLLSYFINFIANGVRAISHDLNQMISLLHTASALISNTYLNFEPQPYLNVLVQGVVYCVLEPLAASINPRNDHWVLRDYAACLLAKIVNKWDSPVNHLRYNTIKSLKDALYDLTKPHCSHYGAVMALLALGCQVVKDIVVPHLAVIMPHLSAVMEDNSLPNAVAKADAYKVHGALLLAAELLLKQSIHEFESKFIPDEDVGECVLETLQINSSNNSDELPGLLDKSPSDFYKELHEYFGDSLSVKLPIMDVSKVFKPVKTKEKINLSDPEGSKTGEQLLEDFMEQVRIQQKLDEERREREEKERIERERLEKIRQEQERLERLKREEEEKKRKEEERKRREMEEKLRRQEEEMMKRKIEEHRRKKEEHQRRKEKELLARKVAEEKRKAEEEKRKAELELKRAAEKAQRAAVKLARKEQRKVKALHTDEEVSEEEEDQEEEKEEMEEQEKDQPIEEDDDEDEDESLNWEDEEQARLLEEEQQRLIREQQRVFLEEQEREKRLAELERLEAERIRKEEEERQRLEQEQQKRRYEEQRKLGEETIMRRRRLSRQEGFYREDSDSDSEVKPRHSRMMHLPVDTKEKLLEKSVVEVESETPAVADITSTIADPAKGIKLKIKLQPRVKLQLSQDKSSGSKEKIWDKSLDKHKDSKQRHKRKHSGRSPKSFDPFEFDKSDPEENRGTRMSLTPLHIYSPSGESSGSDSTVKKSKLTLKLKVPSKETMSE
ncbi:eukaryotic translation initiation factor 5B-like [Gigantopelta aegis]|uniref:eukaryotic translation initiation factor 5B-like n=1 Tax=Gigantopelta aegis TaxID=1735272 RepID=UPI001B888B5A|nr:eukaryotic translation initiation factor 5B-like [Gigantopelta aegis]XP_041353436.1 eukaryotic translation initiation factor 5B-like [Gigantopelta aegis]